MVQTKRKSLQQERVLQGLCPLCGKDAAPYRSCAECRRLAALTRALKRMAKLGVLSQPSRGMWSLGSTDLEAVRHHFRAMPAFGEGKASDDKRLEPRLLGLRVDVEQTLIELLRDMGRPATVEELQAAWGRLRGERKHGSLAADIRTIVEAKRKRDEKNARRARAMLACQSAA